MKSNLVAIMKDKNITIRALEELSKVNNVTICRARRDDMIGKCSLDTLDRIARALEVSVHDLFDDAPGRS